jgi:hypothetical protein
MQTELHCYCTVQAKTRRYRHRQTTIGAEREAVTERQVQAQIDKCRHRQTTIGAEHRHIRTSTVTWTS